MAHSGYWLEKLGTMLNWKIQIFIFDWDGKPHIFERDPALVQSMILLKAILRTLTKEGQ